MLLVGLLLFLPAFIYADQRCNSPALPMLAVQRCVVSPAERPLLDWLACLPQLPLSLWHHFQGWQRSAWLIWFHQSRSHSKLVLNQDHLADSRSRKSWVR